MTAIKNEVKWEQHLLESVLKGATAEELAELCAKLIGNPIALLNAAHTIMAVSSDYPQDDLQDRLTRNELLAQNNQGKKYFSADFWTALRKGTPFSPPLLYLRRGHVICGSIICGKIAGLILLPDVGTPFKDLNNEHICIAARIWGVMLLMHYGLNGTNSFADQEILEDLLTSPESAEKMLKEKSPAYMPFGQSNAFRVLYVNGHSAALQNAFSGICSIPAPDNSEGIVALIGDDDKPDLALWEALAVESNLCIGISDAYEDLSQTALHYQQAQKAVYYCHIMQKEQHLCHYDAFRFLAMLDSIPDKQAYLDSRLLPIEQYDAENQTDYATTLRYYLLFNKDAAAVTEKLHIHKNTLLYRINRIRELFGIDLNDCLQLSSLYCSIMLQCMQPSAQNTTGFNKQSPSNVNE